MVCSRILERVFFAKKFCSVVRGHLLSAMSIDAIVVTFCLILE